MNMLSPSPTSSQPAPWIFWFKPNKHDFSAAISFTCAVMGIGSLGMGRAFGRAGAWPACIQLLLMYLFNTFAAVALSITMRQSPRHVQTFGDLGEYVAGPFGRYFTVSMQFGTCLLVPIAFLVLGGSMILPNLLQEVWPDASPNVMIPLMAITLLPFALVRTLKEGTFAAVLGSLGAAVGVLISVSDSMVHSPYFINTAPRASASVILSVFGTMAMSYGGSVIIPAIQREHPQPERMPTIIVAVFTTITICYWLIGIEGVHQYGCVAPQNLLLSMSNRVSEILAMSFFLVHITLAYAVYLNPAVFLFERMALGLHSEIQADDSELGKISVSSQHPRVESISVDATMFLGKENETPIDNKFVELVPFTPHQRMKSYILRTTVVSIQVFIAMLAQNSFDDIADFVGATCIAWGGIVIPCFIYWKMFSKSMSQPMKIIVLFIVSISIGVGFYSSYLSFKEIVDQSSQFELFHSEPIVTTNLLDENTRWCAHTPSKK